MSVWVLNSAAGHGLGVYADKASVRAAMLAKYPDDAIVETVFEGTTLLSMDVSTDRGFWLQAVEVEAEEAEVKG